MLGASSYCSTESSLNNGNTSPYAFPRNKGAINDYNNITYDFGDESNKYINQNASQNVTQPLRKNNIYHNVNFLSPATALFNKKADTKEKRSRSFEIPPSDGTSQNQEAIHIEISHSHDESIDALITPSSAKIRDDINDNQLSPLTKTNHLTLPVSTLRGKPILQKSRQYLCEVEGHPRTSLKDRHESKNHTELKGSSSNYSSNDDDELTASQYESSTVAINNNNNKNNNLDLYNIQPNPSTNVSNRYLDNLDRFDSQIHRLFPGLALYNKEYYRRKKISILAAKRNKRQLKTNKENGATINNTGPPKTTKVNDIVGGNRKNKAYNGNTENNRKLPMNNHVRPFKNKVSADGKNIENASWRSMDSAQNYLHNQELANKERSNAATKRTRKKTVLEKAKEDLKTDPTIIRELLLGQRIGFYKIKGDIGTGNFSQVRLAIHSLTNEKVAIKILDKTKLDQKTRKLLSREVFIMELLHHPHIIRIYEVIDSATKINIIMEYASGGELYTKINKEGPLDEHLAKKLFCQILSAVEHCHDKCIIHRDIKAENIFFFSSDNVKLGDFGFSTTCQPKQLLTTYCGSPLYAAPELFKDEGYIGNYVDIWALGILLYYMITGKTPFTADSLGRLKKIITQGIYELPPSPYGHHQFVQEENPELRALSGIKFNHNNNNSKEDAMAKGDKEKDGEEDGGQASPRKKISDFFQQIKEGITGTGMEPYNAATTQNALKKWNPTFVSNGKIVKMPADEKYVNFFSSQFRNTNICMSPECKNLVMGILWTDPPSRRWTIAQIKQCLWLKNQSFPKPHSPIRILPPIEKPSDADVSQNDLSQTPNPMKSNMLKPPSPQATSNDARNNQKQKRVDSEFEEVKKELLALGITEQHLKEALTRNTRNSIIGTYRILLHKVHKSNRNFFKEAFSHHRPSFKNIGSTLHLLPPHHNLPNQNSSPKTTTNNENKNNKDNNTQCPIHKLGKLATNTQQQQEKLIPPLIKDDQKNETQSNSKCTCIDERLHDTKNNVKTNTDDPNNHDKSNKKNPQTINKKSSKICSIL